MILLPQNLAYNIPNAVGLVEGVEDCNSVPPHPPLQVGCRDLLPLLALARARLETVGAVRGVDCSGRRRRRCPSSSVVGLDE